MLYAFIHRCSKKLALLAALLFMAVLPALAQISYQKKGEHKHLRRKFVKQADTVEATYKATHLDVSAYNFKIGEPGRSRIKSKKYHYSAGSAPEKKHRFLFWKKKEKKRQRKSDN